MEEVRRACEMQVLGFGDRRTGRLRPLKGRPSVDPDGRRVHGLAAHEETERCGECRDEERYGRVDRLAPDGAKALMKELGAAT